MAFDYSSVKNKKRKDGKTSGFDYSSVVGKTERTEEEKREYVKQRNSQKNDIRNNPDYAEVSKRGRANYQQFYDDRTSNWFGNWVKDTYAGKLVAPQWEKYSEEEKDMYGYLYETDRDKANKYMLELNKSYETAERKKKIDAITEWAEEKPVMASVASLVANVGAPIDYIKNVGGGMATERIFGEGVILPRTGFSDVATAMQSGVQKRIEENTDVEVLGANVAAQLYGMGMSIANSAALITAMGPLAVVEMSMQAAASATNEALDRGVSDVQAVKYGTAAGVAEALGEYLSIEHLFKLKSPHTIKQAIKSALAQAGVEASEEAVTTVMNSISDFVINGDKSEYATQVAFYLSEGYSQKEAEGKATWDSIKGLTWDAIGGAVSGLVLSGGSMALGSVFGNTQQENDARKAVKDLGKDRNKVLDFAMKTEEGSEVRKAAEDIVARTEKGEKVSNKEYADLLLKTDDNFAKAEIKRQLEAEATSTGEELSDEQLDSMSTAMLKTIKGKMVSEQENAQIEQSQSAKNVYARNTGRDYAYGEGLSKEEAKKLIDSREQQIIAEVTADQNEEYQKAVSEAYSEYAQSDAQLKIDAESFAEMFASFYESGKVGYTSVDKALNTYKNIDTSLKNAFSKAYELGKADLEADNVAQNEFRQAAAKKGVEGKIVFEGEARRAAKNKQQTTALEFMGRVLKKSAGIEYHVFSSYILEEDLTYTNKEGKTVELKAGSRVYKDKNGEIVSAPSGFYDAESRQIWVDLNAGAEGIGLMLDTLTHEHVHDIRVWSYEHYKQLLDITKESIEAKGVDFDDVVAEMYDLYHNKKNRKDYTIEKAKEEVVAKTMSGLLRDENGLREFSQQVYAKDKTLWEKIKDWFADVVARLTNAYKDVDLDSALAQNLKDQKELYEKAQKIFAEAVVQAGQNYKAVESGAFKGLYKTTEGNSDVYVTEKGNVIAVSEKGNANNVMYNIGEYDNGGRDYLENWLTKAVKKKAVSQDVKNQMLQAMDNAAELVRDLEKSFPVFKEWGEVSLAYDDSGKPIMRCKVKNGDYEINFDFSTVCKKRKGLDAVLNNLIKTGKIDLIDLSRSDIQFINKTLDKYDFEIACALCFVGSKRYRVGEWASGAATMYNDLINSLVKPEDLNKISSFNFGGNENKNIIEGDISTWDDSRLDFSTLKEILASDSRAGGMGYKKAFAKLIIENPKYRKFLSSSDIVSSRGTDRMRNEANDLLEAVNAIGGSSKPKMSNSESVWDHSILMDRRVTAKSSFAMGGARTQSFSDFIATMFFDYCQMFAEAQAKGLPMQAYTKELAFAELFGLTGARINLSVLHGVKISAEDRAWLDSKYVVNKDGELELKITTQADKERLEAIKRNAGLDENGNYVPEKQSIDFDKAVSLQNRNGYSRYLGTIVVGVSERHIWKLLDDMRVRMIIPYHKSGLSPVIAKARNIDCYTDFTLSQNTRLGESWGEDAGKTIGSTALSDEGNERLKAIKDAGKKWDFYSVLHKYEEDWDTATNSWKEGTNHAETITYELSSNGKNVFQNDPMRQTCEDYFAWCVEYDMIPQFDQFMKHPNYYKMQEDFDVYDCITGEYVPQTAVKFKLPDNARKILESELEAQQETSDRLNEKMPEMVDEIVNTIGRKIPPEIKIGKMMNERDSDGNILSKGQQEYFKDSKVRDEDGNLLVVYHGTDANFTVFDRTKTRANMDIQGNFFSPWEIDAGGYGGNVKAYYLNIVNPAPEQIAYKALRKFQGQNEAGAKARDYLIALGYDGVNNGGEEYIAFESNQIKLIDNKTPTADPDIRYSLRDVEPVLPSSDKWKRTATTSEVMARFPDLWNVTAEESEVRNPTQITGTVRSYRKIYDFLKDEGFDGKILDASSGLGYGTKAGIEEYGFDVEDIEPYPDKNYHPKYKDYSKLNKKYDVIISNAVLNVIPQDQRDALVVKMGELLNEGGRMFINVRGKDVENASSKVAINEDLMEYYISSTGSYQKGFTKPELVAYLQDALGDGFTVTSTNIVNGVAAVVTKNEGQPMYDERISTFDDQLLALENKNKKLVKEMENLMLKYEAAQDRAKKNILAGQMAQGKKDAAELRRKTESFEKKLGEKDEQLQKKRSELKEVRNRRDELLAEEIQKKKAELKKVRERRDEILEEKNQAYAAYREKTRESIASGGLRKSVERNTKTLYDWLMKNSDKEHVPEALKTTVGNFLESIDFTSKRGLAGGEATKKDQAFAQRLNNLAAMLEKQRNYMNKANEGDAENPLDCFLDLPEGFAEEVRKLADDVAKTAIGGNFVVNEMNSEQLAQLNKALRILKTSISKMNKLITNAHFASVTEAARSSMLEMAEYKAHKPMNDISEQADKMLKWEMFTPVYAFKRYGGAGESIFKGIQKGWSDFAFAIDKVLKFTEGTYTDKEVEAWEKETHSIKLSDGKTVTLTTAQLMSLYCLNKREQARGHIYGGGIRIADIKEGKVKIQQTEPYLVSFEDVETLIAELSDRQIAVADKLQKFMTEQGSEWGNKVSMERFGYRAFTEENYFPIESDANNLIAIDPEAKANDMFRLLNMSATKSLTKGANNAIVISDIFDIFSNHMSDMAKYGSLALPILDTMKWYNYKVRYDVGDGKFRTETVQKSVERAYGKAGKSYFTNFIKDLNGVKEGGRGIGFVSKMVSNYKIASVGANLRVALLQPTSIVRASMEIEPKYILKALTKLPAAKKAESKSGIALWKSLGFYNTDIARGVREQIKGGGKTVDKIRDKTMILAEQMDRVTFGTLWNAAEAKAKDLGYSGEELDVKTTEIFDNIIYKTQVVDSTLTRSSLMRSTNEVVKSITAFMAEPTLSYNMVAETVYDMAKERDFSTGWQKNSKRFGKAVSIYVASSIAAAVIESIPDAFRDDDDDEWFGQKWWQAFWGEKFWDGNLWSEINILEKIPILKDFISVRKGYDIQRLDAAWMSSLNKAIEINTELYNVYVKGEKPTKTTYWGNMTTYGAAYANLRAISQITGLPVSNTVRDVVAIWNTIVGRMAPSLKLKTYDDSKK